MRNKDRVTLGDIYGEMLKSVEVVEEGCGLCASDNISKSKKTPKMPENAFTKKNELQKGGPTEKGGFHKALNDSQDYDTDEDEESETPISKLRAKLKNKNLSDKDRKNITAELRRLEKGAQNEEAEEEIVQESKKIARDRLNKFMTKKSTFDKLFESVMGGVFDAQEDAQEVDALGLGDAPTDDEFESEGEGEDQVTITLDRASAQQLLDVLQAAVGGEEEFGGDDEFGGDEDLDFGDEGEVDEDAEETDDDEMSYDEDEESTFPTDKVGNDGTTGASNSKDGSHPLQQKNNKVQGKPQPKGSTTKVVGTTDKVGNDGDHGHAIKGGKQPDMGKQNKVSDIRQAEDFFR